MKLACSPKALCQPETLHINPKTHLSIHSYAHSKAPRTTTPWIKRQIHRSLASTRHMNYRLWMKFQYVGSTGATAKCSQAGATCGDTSESGPLKPRGAIAHGAVRTSLGLQLAINILPIWAVREFVGTLMVERDLLWKRYRIILAFNHETELIGEEKLSEIGNYLPRTARACI